jgi:hypothetical protein
MVVGFFKIVAILIGIGFALRAFVGLSDAISRSKADRATAQRLAAAVEKDRQRILRNEPLTSRLISFEAHQDRDDPSKECL